jgi:hypothetical protein
MISRREASLKKTKKLVTTLLAGIVVTSMTGCGSQAAPTVPQPTDPSCKDWEWDENEGVWECDDRASSHYGAYYYGGLFFASRSLLHNNSGFKNYHSDYKNSINKGKSGGFGSGSKGPSGG